jgi:hypothetical protein
MVDGCGWIVEIGMVGGWNWNGPWTRNTITDGLTDKQPPNLPPSQPTGHIYNLEKIQCWRWMGVHSFSGLLLLREMATGSELRLGTGGEELFYILTFYKGDCKLLRGRRFRWKYYLVQKGESAKQGHPSLYTKVSKFAFSNHSF